MKKLKRAAALLLALAIVLGLSGCGGKFERKLIKGAKQMQKIENLHMDLSADIDMELTLIKKKIPMDFDVLSASDVQISPFKMSSSHESDFMGLSKEVYSYVEKSEGGYEIMSSLDGRNWVSEYVESEESESEIDFLGMLSLALKYTSSFEEKGQEQLGSYNTILFEGTVTDENLRELLELLGGREVFEKSLEGFSNVEQALYSLDESYSIPSRVWIDENSGIIIKYELDLTELGVKLFEAAMLDMLDELNYEIPKKAMKLKLSKLVLSLSLSQFDAVGEIKIPKAA